MNNYDLFIEKMTGFHNGFTKILNSFSVIKRDESTNIFIPHDFNNVFKRYNDPIVKKDFNILKTDGRYHFNEKILMSINKAQFNIELLGANSNLPIGIKNNSVADYSSHYASDDQGNYIFGIQPLGLSIFGYDYYHDGGMFDYVLDYESPFWFNDLLNESHWLFDIFSAIVNYQFDKNLQRFIKQCSIPDKQLISEILDVDEGSTHHKYALIHKYTVDKLIYELEDSDMQGYPIFLSEKDFKNDIWLPESFYSTKEGANMASRFLNDVFRQTFIDACDLLPKYVNDVIAFYQEIIQELNLLNESLSS